MKAGTPPIGKHIEPGTESGFVLVPRYDVEASAGHGMIPNDQVLDFLAFQTEWLTRELGVHPTKLACIQARGDSMEPTISNGDLLLIDLSTPGGYDDSIYAIGVGENLIVKRVQYLLDGSVRIISDNPKYESQVVKPGELTEMRIIGRVVWAGRRM